MSQRKEKITMVPLERELVNAGRRREIMDELLAMQREVDLLMKAQLDGATFSAWEKFRQAIMAAIGIIKSFRA
jgi:hypothetical protein